MSSTRLCKNSLNTSCCRRQPCLLSLAPHNAGKYKLVTFAHKELNLYKVFWEVQARGGYQAVCATKQWKVRDIIVNPPNPRKPSRPSGRSRRATAPWPFLPSSSLVSLRNLQLKSEPLKPA